MKVPRYGRLQIFQHLQLQSLFSSTQGVAVVSKDLGM